MPLQNTTPVPNEFFSLLSCLTDHEVRFLLLVIRQTWGWQGPNKKRKQRDRMTYGYISKKTGLYRACLSATIQSLIDKRLLHISDESGNVMDIPSKRKGKRHLYYEYLRKGVYNSDTTNLQLQTQHILNSEYNKRNTNKINSIQKKEPNEYRRYKRYLEDLHQ